MNFAQHYEGDVNDLGLTFTWSEEVLGETVTHELLPGGRTIALTNENRISYVHLVAHLRMRTQIREQLVAFARGFGALIHPHWLAAFSAPELQQLISGDLDDLDLSDLRCASSR